MPSLEWTGATIPTFHALFAPSGGRQKSIMYKHSVPLTSPGVRWRPGTPVLETPFHFTPFHEFVTC